MKNRRKIILPHYLVVRGHYNSNTADVVRVYSTLKDAEAHIAPLRYHQVVEDWTRTAQEGQTVRVQGRQVTEIVYA